MALATQKFPPNSFFPLWGGNCVTSSGGKEVCGFSDLSWLVESGLVKRNDRQFALATLLAQIPLPETIPLDKVHLVAQEADRPVPW